MLTPSTQETKTAEATKSDATKTDGKPSPTPEKYEFKAPDGWDGKGWELDPAIIDRATPMFKELGLTQDQAQKLVNFYATESAQDHERTLGLVAKQSETWMNEAKADKDIGHKLDSDVKVTMGRALDAIGDPALVKSFKETMDLTGVGNNIAFIKTFYKLAQRYTEGQHVSGGGPSKLGQSAPNSGPRSAASALYPNHP